MPKKPDKCRALNLYIFELYEKIYDDEYYDENIEYYVKNTFFKLILIFSKHLKMLGR